MPSKREVALPQIFEQRNHAFARALLEDYYARFTGRHFDTLGRGGSANPTEITAADLVAVSTLSVNVPGVAAVRILECEREEISELLIEMATDERPLWEVTLEEVMDREWAPYRLWDLLRRNPPINKNEPAPKRDGMGQTTVSKLIARKRPDLVPIYDEVIRRALGLRSSGLHWVRVRDLMRTTIDCGPEGTMPLHEWLADACRGLELPPAVTPLRAFDVIVWYANNDASETVKRRECVRLRSTDGGARGSRCPDDQPADD